MIQPFEMRKTHPIKLHAGGVSTTTEVWNVLVKTDEEGRFKLTILEGSKGTVHGYLYSFSRDSANCPQVNKLVKAYKDIGTSRVKLEMNRDHQNIELTFRFRIARKARNRNNLSRISNSLPKRG
jgi:hypothetical protein